jgi:autotransporter-associated beta strand protein
VILDGAGEGVLDGTVNPGLFGAVIKRGTGTWTINSRNNKYVYPTEVEAGTLVLGGALASDVIVKSGATLVLKPGALMKRSLTLEKGATLVYDNISELEQEPAIVWGSAKIDGNVRLARRPKTGISYRLVSAENGCEIGDLDIPGMKVICDGQNVILRKRHGFTVHVK